MLRAVVGLLDSNGSAFAIYELAEGERFETRDENRKPHHIRNPEEYSSRGERRMTGPSEHPAGL